MDAREPEQKRLRRIAEELDEIYRMDMMKSLGERGQPEIVLNILRFLTAGEIWEVISHSLPLRQLLHRRGVWKRLAEMKFGTKSVDAFVARLRNVSNLTEVNYFWYICVREGYAVRTKSGIVVRKWRKPTTKNEPKTYQLDDGRVFYSPSKNWLEFRMTRFDSDLVSTYTRAFPDAHYKIDTEVDALIFDGNDDPIFASKDTVTTAQTVFVYMIMARGGSVLVSIHNDDDPVDQENLDWFLDYDDDIPEYFHKIHFIRSELH
jgi:hypothetical protein